MKHFGSILEFTRQRNDEIMRVYRYHLSQSDRIFLPCIYELVSDSPASRFWVSEECAANVVSAMMAGKTLPRIRPNKREMFEEIFRRYCILQKQFPDRTISGLVSDVIHQPAPKFYIAPLSIREIIRKIKTGWYDRQFDLYKDLRDDF